MTTDTTNSSNYPADQNSTAVAPPTIHQKTVKPLVTYWILGISIFIFVLKYISEWTTGYDFPFLIGGKINEYILQGEVWRLLTPVFLHGSLAHLGFNMYALYAMGRSLEQHFGHTRFFVLYMVGGFTGNVLSYVFSPNPSLGSSTAIFGLLAAEGVFIYQNRKMFGKDSQRMLINTVSIALINFVFGLSTSRIDNWGHLGGLLGGVIFAWIAGPIWKIEGLYPTYHVIDSRASHSIWTGAISAIGIFSIVALVKTFLF